MPHGSTLAAIAFAAGGAAIVALTRQGTPTGAITGLVIATVAILGLGPGALLPMAVFVLGSGILTRVGRTRKEAAGAAEPNAGRRGVRHVAAKLGLPALLGIVAMLGGDSRLISVAYAGAIAGAFADTAATEVGPLFRGMVFGLRRGRAASLAHGEPGGVSAAGLITSGLGAAAVALAAAGSDLIASGSAAPITAAGFGAALVESVLGGGAIGRVLGHLGRNVMVSLLGAAFALWLSLLGGGRP